MRLPFFSPLVQMLHIFVIFGKYLPSSLRETILLRVDNKRRPNSNMLHTWVQETFVEKTFTNQRETHVVTSAAGLVSSFENFEMILMLCPQFVWTIGYRKSRLLNAINAF
jgi:preprotein translocase subunit Sec61beta